MVERLKEAIEKARLQRGSVEQAPPLTTGARRVDWTSIEEIAPNAARMRRERIVTHEKRDPAYVPFDVLRTRLLRLCRQNGWWRIGVASPRKGCGKSFVSVNLAFSLSRSPSVHTLLLDMDFKNPSIARMLGVEGDYDLTALLSSQTRPADALRRIGGNLAFGLNTTRVRDSAELLHSDQSAAAFNSLRETLAPDIALVDLPPLLASDDALGFLGNLDGLLLVIAAGHTKSRMVSECERLISGQTEFLGVILNKVDEASAETATYSEYDPVSA